MFAQFKLSAVWFISRKKEAVIWWFAKRMPRKLRYFAVAYAAGQATTGKYANTSPANLTVIDLMRRMEI